MVCCAGLPVYRAAAVHWAPSDPAAAAQSWLDRRPGQRCGPPNTAQVMPLAVENAVWHAFDYLAVETGRSSASKSKLKVGSRDKS